MIAPKLGLQFIHRAWLDAQNKPMAFRVTRIAQGVVYYRPVNGGGGLKCGTEEFNGQVARVVS